jgi:hypothetical protein
MWFPSSQARIAMTLPSRVALLRGAICWFGFGGAVTAGSMAGLRSHGWPDDPLLAFFDGFLMGGMIAVFAVIPLASFASLDADLTTEHRRARVRLFLSCPGRWILPGVLWERGGVECADRGVGVVARCIWCFAAASVAAWVGQDAGALDGRSLRRVRLSAHRPATPALPGVRAGVLSGADDEVKSDYRFALSKRFGGSVVAAAGKALVVWGGWDGHQPKEVGELFRRVLTEEGFQSS